MADNCKNEIRTDRVDVLDGIRAGAILIVAFFHFWQQSWYSFNYSSPFLKKIGIDQINFDWIHRYGYIFVDMMILMTGFCLFLPYARYMIEGTKRPGLPDVPSVLEFYRKRLARIVPSYLLCFVLYLSTITLPGKNYAVWTDVFKDKMLWVNIVRQLTFTQNLQRETYLGTQFNGALWTVAVEMQFYLIFPLLAWAFSKKPILTFGCMNLVSYSFIHFVVLPKADGDLGMYINQLLALFGVFGCGMIGALIFVTLANALKTRNKYISLFFTGGALASIFAVFAIMRRGASAYSHIQRWQVTVRSSVSVLFTVFVISSCFAFGWYRKLFSNRLARFAAAISYNFYIWHQTIAVKMKEWHIPAWPGEDLPNVAGDRPWQIKYTILIFVASVTFATCITYGFEKPMAKLILGRKNKK